MTTPNLYPGGLDPAHIARICTATASPEPGNDGVLLAGGRYPVRVFLPRRAQARLTEAALRRTGYDAERVTRPGRGRDLIVYGWSNELLDARLTAMRAVIGTLQADVTATAARTIDRLAQLPADGLPDPARQEELARQARQELYAWAHWAIGMEAGPDLRAAPADTGSVLRIHAAENARKLISGLLAWHHFGTRDALTAYTQRRAAYDHQQARVITLQSLRAARPDSSPVTELGPDPAGTESPGSALQPARRARRPRPAEPTRIFPGGSPPALHGLLPLAGHRPDPAPGPAPIAEGGSPARSALPFLEA
jgi:hypothetical protein